MIEKYKILGKYIKDMSSETPNIETYLFVRENISKYQLDIDINSKPLKNKHIEINTTLRFEDKSKNQNKSHFEIIFTTIASRDDLFYLINFRSPITFSYCPRDSGIYTLLFDTNGLIICPIL